MSEEYKESVTIFTKDGIFATIGVITFEGGGIMTSRDPRNTNPGFYQESTSNPDAARTRYNQSVKTSVERGWRVVYSGQRLNG